MLLIQDVFLRLINYSGVFKDWMEDVKGIKMIGLGFELLRDGSGGVVQEVIIVEERKRGSRVYKVYEF